MNSDKIVRIVAGTRPEVIKLAPVYKAFKNKIKTERLPVKIQWISTGQHKEMVMPLYDHFSITPDFDLSIMRSNQKLSDILANTLLGLEKINSDSPSALLIGQGDTTSAMATGIFAFQEKIPFAHIEAGLRTKDLSSPFPEEFNRRVLALTSKWHFAPTENSKINLVNEGISESSIFVTGNTSIDALLWSDGHLDVSKFSSEFKGILDNILNRKFGLITLHRRENWGMGLSNITSAIQELANEDKITFLFPVHLNPKINQPIKETLGNIKNVILTSPLNYPEFLWAMKNAQTIITDSGGIQEEALSFATPLVITRENTERPEGLKTGLAQLCGTNKEMIKKQFRAFWNITSKPKIENPYGDGTAAIKIANELLKVMI